MDLPRMDWPFLSTLVLASLVDSSLLQAYPTPVDFYGEPLRWHIQSNDPPINYEVVADNVEDLSYYGPLVDEAALMWNEVSTSYFSYDPVQTDQGAQVSVYLEEKSSQNGFSAGYAEFDDFDEEKGPKHCSIHIDVSYGPAAISFGQTALHELGHCLGLGHSLVPEAVMSYDLDKNGFYLSTDDQAAISRLYPSSQTNPKLPPGCAINAGEKQQNAMVLVLVLLPVLFVRIKTR